MPFIALKHISRVYAESLIAMMNDFDKATFVQRYRHKYVTQDEALQ
jgi:hypothetical protein